MDASVHCNSCGKETHHTLLASHRHEFPPDASETDASDTYEVLKCAGCGDPVFRKRYYFSEWQSWDPDDHSGVVYQDTYYPPRMFRQPPEWRTELPEDIQAPLSELYVALQNGLLILASIGARVVLDVAISGLSIPDATYKERLEKLQSRGHVSADERELLETLVEVGGAAAHRSHKITSDDLVVIVDILESVLEKMYLADRRAEDLAERARRIRSGIPPRSSKSGGAETSLK